MELKFKNNDLFISPRLEEFQGAFHDLVDKIAYIAYHLPSLESWIQSKGWRRLGLRGDTTEIDIARNNYTMFAPPPNWYLNEVHQRLNMILQKSFLPLSDYVEKLKLQFGSVFYEIDQVHCDVVMFPIKELSSDECIMKVEDFNQLIRMINGMV